MLTRSKNQDVKIFFIFCQLVLITNFPEFLNGKRKENRKAIEKTAIVIGLLCYGKN